MQACVERAGHHKGEERPGERVHDVGVFGAWSSAAWERSAQLEDLCFGMDNMGCKAHVEAFLEISDNI